jgi:nicotinate-nucleotide adenylyltransferase
MFVNIGKWHRAEDLLRNFAFVMGRRPGTADDEAEALAETWRKDYGAEIAFVENALFQVSSSEIRRRVAEGSSIRYLVPEKVREYIYESNLYR